MIQTPEVVTGHERLNEPAPICPRLILVMTLVERDGWRFHSQTGSHRQCTHATKPGRVTIAAPVVS